MLHGGLEQESDGLVHGQLVRQGTAHSLDHSLAQPCRAWPTYPAVNHATYCRLQVGLSSGRTATARARAKDARC